MKLSLKPGETSYDEKVTGLHLRALQSKKRSWYVYYRTKTGQERRPKIGEYPLVSLPEARRRAANILARVAIGEDPQGDWQKGRAAPRVDEVFEGLVTEHWSAKRFVESGRLAEVRRTWVSYLQQRFGSAKVTGVTREHVRHWHRQLSSTPYQANRALEILRQVFSFAEDSGLIEHNPATRVDRFREEVRDRIASIAEIRAVGRELEKYRRSHPREVAYVLLAMTTGARPTDVMKLAWKDVRFAPDGSAMVSLDGKSTKWTGIREQVVIPADTVKHVVRGLPKREDGLVIGPVEYRRFWEKVRLAAGCPDLRLRDWRRTFATYGLGIGQDMGVIGRVLNHRSLDTTKRYAELVDPKRVEAVNSIAKEVTSHLK